MRFIVVLALLASGTAWADEPDYKTAKMHWDRAEEAMAAGDYETAVSEYGKAYDLTKDAILFLRIGNAYHQAGKCDSAVIYWKRYLKEGTPTAEVTEATEAKIEACEGTGVGEGALEPGEKAETIEGQEYPGDPIGSEPDPESGSGAGMGGGTGEAEPSFMDEKPSWKKSAGWISLGATVVLGTAGAILAMSGESREEDIASLGDFRDPQGRPATYDGTVAERYDEIIAEGERFNTMASVMFVAAGVSAVAAATLLYLDSREGSESGSAIVVAPALGPDGASVSARLRF